VVARGVMTDPLGLGEMDDDFEATPPLINGTRNSTSTRCRTAHSHVQLTATMGSFVEQTHKGNNMNIWIRKHNA